MMTIDPRVGFYLSLFLAVCGFLAGAGTQFTALFGDHTANIILAVTVLLLGCGNAVNAVLHAIPSKPGANDEFLLGPKKSS
jgi:hypothetical protein